MIYLRKYSENGVVKLQIEKFQVIDLVMIFEAEFSYIDSTSAVNLISLKLKRKNEIENKWFR